jgi:amidophosphoribosyltransferase
MARLMRAPAARAVSGTASDASGMASDASGMASDASGMASAILGSGAGCGAGSGGDGERDRRFGCECGIVAVHGHRRAAELAYYGLFALQHRGQESAGIATADSATLRVRRGMGLVADALQPADLAALVGGDAVGHTRYSTTGSSTLANAQPLYARLRQGEVAVAHNGNLVNAAALRSRCEAAGSIFQGETDTEVIPHLMARADTDDLTEALCEALAQVRGAYALAVLAPDRILLARDPHGIRPLSLGRLGDSLLAASETCALDAMGARPLRDVEPGEVVELRGGRAETVASLAAGQPALCLFEFIYLARPDSDLQGRNVHLARKAMGRRLWQEAPADADVVVGVPDSGISAAVGYAEAGGIPYEMGLVKNRYVARTFIQPAQALREAGVSVKLNAVRRVLAGRRVVVVDDSIVRGTTTRRLVSLLRDAGATAVHLRISAPPFRHPCYYGIDIPTEGELLAAGRSVGQMAAEVGADSLAFLSEEGSRLAAADGASADGFCTACFTGRYPVAPVPDTGKVAR